MWQGLHCLRALGRPTYVVLLANCNACIEMPGSMSRTRTSIAIQDLFPQKKKVTSAFLGANKVLLYMKMFIHFIHESLSLRLPANVRMAAPFIDFWIREIGHARHGWTMMCFNWTTRCSYPQRLDLPDFPQDPPRTEALKQQSARSTKDGALKQ